MKIKLDENLPTELARLLAEARHDVHTVQDEALTGEDDGRVFDAACREGRLLVTQDLDFSDIRRFTPGTHPGIVLVRLREPSRRRLVDRIKQAMASEPIDRWSGCFVVISDHKMRVLRPK